VATAGIALVTILRTTGTVDSDVAWQLWIAHRMHAGAKLYRDIIEVNPPLWFWMALPVDSLATALQLRVESVAVATMGGLSALSLGATAQLIEGRPAQRGLLLAYAGLMFMATPWMHVGQREQIVLIGTLPYAALTAARRSGAQLSPSLAGGIGIAAALGFALKPYFLLVPVVLELWLLVSQGKAWRPLRAETVALVAVGLLYAVAVFVFADEYLTRALPLVRLAYGVTGAPFISALLSPMLLAAAAAAGLAATRPRFFRADAPGLPAALLMASLGFGIAYFIQSKGWTYHAIPMVGCACLALAAVLTGGETVPRLTRLTAPAVLCLPLVFAIVEARAERAPGEDLIEAVDGMHAGDSVGFIATDPAFAWSIALQRRVDYPSRYMGFWMMRAVVANELRGGPDQRLSALGRQVVAETVADFRCLPPRRIVIARPRPGEDGFDILPFFLRDRRFAELLSHYRARSRTTVETYELVSPLAPPAAACRRSREEPVNLFLKSFQT